MKSIKRILTAVLAAVLILAAALPSFAADKIIDYVLYTDIRTYINNVEITSYNIKGNTAVVVEDLLNYGFDVVWDGAARTLKVTRNASKPVTGAEVKATSGGKIGDKAMPVYATDIKTYLDGKETESYNVGGQTIVYVDDLAKLYASDYQWDQNTRTLKAVLSGSAAAPAAPAAPVPAEAVLTDDEVHDKLADFLLNYGTEIDDSYAVGRTSDDGQGIVIQYLKEMDIFSSSYWAEYETLDVEISVLLVAGHKDVEDHLAPMRITVHMYDSETTYEFNGYIDGLKYAGYPDTAGVILVDSEEHEVEVADVWHRLAASWGRYTNKLLDTLVPGASMANFGFTAFNLD